MTRRGVMAGLVPLESKCICGGIRLIQSVFGLCLLFRQLYYICIFDDWLGVL